MLWGSQKCFTAKMKLIFSLGTLVAKAENDLVLPQINGLSLCQALCSAQLKEEAKNLEKKDYLGMVQLVA